MNNLNDPNILSDGIFEVMWRIMALAPNVVYGGSIALNGVGLLNREVGDIDLFFPQNGGPEYFSLIRYPLSENQISETITDINGNPVSRLGVVIDNVHICCFKIPISHLTYSTINVQRGNRVLRINIQNVNYVIQTKAFFSKKSLKHETDLIEIDKILDMMFSTSIDYSRFNHPLAQILKQEK